MADSTVLNLALASALNGNESVYVVQGSADRRATIGQLLGVAKGFLNGLTLSRLGITSLGIDVGVAVDSTSSDAMFLTTASFNKLTSGTWAVGDNQSGLDTGSISTNWYHVFLIKRPDTGVVDVLFSLSATSPTMPANYTLKRRIGSFKYSGGIVDFTQLGDEFRWKDSITDVNNAPTTSSSVTTTLSVPTGVQVHALFNAFMYGPPSTPTEGAAMLFTALDQNAPAGGSIDSSIGLDIGVANTGVNQASQHILRTNTSGQIRRTGAGTVGVLSITTWGWIDSRGKGY